MSGDPSHDLRDRGSLFVEITTITVDPAYVEAAARRAMSGEPDGRRRSDAAGLFGSLVAVGLLVGAAVTQTRAAAPAAARLRRALVAEADRRTAATDDLRARAAELRAETARERDERLRQSAGGRALADRLARLELTTGSEPVRGPGIEVRLSDPPEDGRGSGTGDPSVDGRLHDVDLQEVVNALWAAGAEAVAVNGQRLSALTAIREAGEVILVDRRPLVPPYVVAAIGDPDALEPGFTDTAVARRLRTWEDVFGLSFDVRRRDRMTLQDAETTQLRHATASTRAAP